jgi:hypothetical protein
LICHFCLEVDSLEKVKGRGQECPRHTSYQ